MSEWSRKAEGWSWSPSGEPETMSVDLALPVHTLTLGWKTALARGPRIRFLDLPFSLAAPAAVSIPVNRSRVRVFSYRFPEAPDLPEDVLAPLVPKEDTKKTPVVVDAEGPDAAEPAPVPAGKVPQKRTRIQPPDDIIKVADRLYYMLQPPLQTLVASGALSFPFTPFPYQYEGIAFLYPRYSAVLADEMGLGKTMQAITTIRLLLHAGEVRKVLLVCPKPLVSNWVKEFGLWAPELPTTVIEGDQTRRRWLWSLPDAPIKIANYELVLRDRDVFEDHDLQFDLMILDEAQRIKNKSSTTSQVVRSIPRARNWAITGTPVENSAEDLVGIFEFLAPGYLSENMNARDLGKAAGDYVLRRTKDKVLTELPPKLYRDADVELTLAQRGTYSMAEDEGIVRLDDMGEELTVQHVFELILRLKQICNFDPVTGDSSKCERLEADLEEVVASGSKAIIFSQWVQTLTALRERLARFGTLEYHGKIPHRRREGVIDQFKNDPDTHVILMSYGAGSVGLNLQFCNYVFLFDRWWNPAVEDQAINRAHRIGVDGPVTVTRFLSTGTIEQRIDEVLQQKRELFEAIFSQTSQPSKMGLTHSDIFGLFDLQHPTSGTMKAAA